MLRVVVSRRPERIRGPVPLCRRLGRMVLLLCAAAAQITGCALYGPGVMRTSHLAYNKALHLSSQQEFLLNLVRLRYTDAPEFLTINSIAAQMSFDAGASIGGDLGEVQDARSAFVTPGASVGYSEQPTVSFSPARGAEFRRQLVTPIELETLYLLSQYGSDMGRVLRVVTRELNGIRNVIGRENNDAATASDLRAFARMAELFSRLHGRGALAIAPVEQQVDVSGPVSVESVSAGDLLAAAQAGFRYAYRDDPPRYVLTESGLHYVFKVSKSTRQSEELSELARLLGLERGPPTYELDRAGALAEEADNRTVRIDTRSVLGAMAYLSQAVEVPAEHVERGLVAQDPDIESVFSDLLRIKVAQEAPAETTLAVAYRGYWFYIGEDDLLSKRTMRLLTALFRLEISTGGPQNVPILTLPVSR